MNPSAEIYCTLYFKSHSPGFRRPRAARRRERSNFSAEKYACSPKCRTKEPAAGKVRCSPKGMGERAPQEVREMVMLLQRGRDTHTRRSVERETCSPSTTLFEAPQRVLPFSKTGYRQENWSFEGRPRCRFGEIAESGITPDCTHSSYTHSEDPTSSTR